MTFIKTKPMFYTRDTRAAARGAELMKKSLNRAGEPSTSPAVPTQPWVASKIAKAQADAKNARKEK